MAASSRTARASSPLPSACRNLARTWSRQAATASPAAKVLTRSEEADEFLLMGLRLTEGIDLVRYESAGGQAAVVAVASHSCRTKGWSRRSAIRGCAPRRRHDGARRAGGRPGALREPEQIAVSRSRPASGRFLRRSFAGANGDPSPRQGIANVGRRRIRTLHRRCVDGELSRRPASHNPGSIDAPQLMFDRLLIFPARPALMPGIAAISAFRHRSGPVQVALGRQRSRRLDLWRMFLGQRLTLGELAFRFCDRRPVLAACAAITPSGQPPWR
jgi:hypothetical protein